MVKISGMALIVLCCSMMGIFAASGLSGRILILEKTIRLYQHLRDRLKFLQPSVGALIGQAAAAPEFAELSFLASCHESILAGESFPESWKAAVDGFSGFKREERGIVASLGDVLGASDLDSQLAALEYGISMLEARLSAARDYAQKHKKLYKTLGILAGLAVAILIS